MKEIINVAIVGYGKMGEIRHSILKNRKDIRVITVFDPNNKKPPLDLNNASNIEEIIEDPNIDAVFICTPNYLNAKLSKEFLINGKHVFCEKPPSISSSELNQVILAEEKSNKKLMYGFNHRHHDSIIKMNEIVKSKRYGRILWMRGRYGKSVDVNFMKSWRSKRDLAGGGILLDQGIHMLDLFIYFAGDFDLVKADVSNLYWNLDIEDNVFAIYKNNRTKVVASLHSTMTQWRHLFSLEVFLEGGYMVLNGLKTSSGSYGEEKLSIAQNRSTAPVATWEDEVHEIYKINKSWESEISHFISAIKNNNKIKVGNSNDALKLMRLIDLTYSNSSL